MTSSSIRSILNVALAVWVAMVMTRFIGPEFGLRVDFIDRMGLHVVLLGVCLGLAAADAALSLCGNSRNKEISDG